AQGAGVALDAARLVLGRLVDEGGHHLMVEGVIPIQWKEDGRERYGCDPGFLESHVGQGFAPAARIVGYRCRLAIHFFECRAGGFLCACGEDYPANDYGPAKGGEAMPHPAPHRAE